MQLEKVRYKKKIIAYIHLHLDYHRTASKTEIIDSLVKNIKNSASGYAGFRTKRDLRCYLVKEVFDSKEKIKIAKFNFNKQKVSQIIKDAIALCNKVIPGEAIHIYVFPTFSTFIRTQTFGTSGLTPWKNVVLIFVNPLTKQWPQALPKTIAHEYCHAAVSKYHKWRTLLDSIVFEGLAEHFREYVLGGRRSPWAGALNISQSKKIFEKLKKYLHSKDLKLYHSVFFGDKKYPQWAGYTIGYHIVGSFIANNPYLKWKQIIILAPKEILERSNY